MIYLVDGVPGGGKTYWALRWIVDGVTKGSPIATNVDLVDDWAEQVARMNPARRWRPGAVRDRARDLERLLVRSDDFAELYEYRLRGRGEGRGRMVLDEVHNALNSRLWNDGDRGHHVRFFTQHRKLGWDVALITQYVDMVDKQIRNLIEYRVRTRNLKREKIAGLPIIPGNFFVAVHELAAAPNRGGSPQIVKRDWYKLHKRTARLYDTFATSFGLDDDADQAGLWLPLQPEPTAEPTPADRPGDQEQRPGAGRGDPPAGPAGAASQPAAEPTPAV